MSCRPVSYALASFSLLACAALAPPVAGAAKVAPAVVQAASPAATPSARVGATPATASVEFSVGLQLGDPAGALALEQAVSDPTSASYRQYLTPAQWERRSFAPSKASVEAVSAWLKSQGIAVEDVTPDRMTIEASAPAATIERAFVTTLGQYNRKGKVVRLSSTALSVPSSVAPLISGVVGVDQSVATPSGLDGAETRPAAKRAGKEIPQPPGFRNAPPCSASYGEKSDTTDPPYGEGFPNPLPYAVCRPCAGAFNRPNVTLVDCPTGIEEITAQGPVVDGRHYNVDCIVYGTGFEAEVTPLQRRVGHDIVGRGGISLAEKWSDGAASLFGLMSRGFPNMFVMPAPGQQSVVTVNYTQLAVLGAEFVAGTVALLEKQGHQSFDVSADAEADWIRRIIDTHVDPSAVMSACTPSRLNNEGDPGAIKAQNTNFGPGFGDFFAYRDLLESWLAAGELDGLELT